MLLFGVLYKESTLTGYHLLALTYLPFVEQSYVESEESLIMLFSILNYFYIAKLRQGKYSGFQMSMLNSQILYIAIYKK